MRERPSSRPCRSYLNALAGKGVHVVTVNDYLARRDAEWMGQVYRFLGLDGRPRRARRSTTSPPSGPPTPRTSPTGRTPSSASTTSATTWRPSATRWCSAATTSRSSTRSTRSSSTRRGRRSSSPARRTTRPGSTTSSRASCGPCRRDEDYEVDEEKRTVVPTEAGIAKVERQLGVENLYDAVAVNYVHQLEQGARGQGALPPGQGLHRRRRRGEDRRRVHRPDPRGPPLVRRAPPGGRGEGAGPDQGGEPHLGDGHAAELLPHVRQARRHDRDGRDRGGRVRLDLRPPGRADPDEPADGPRTTSRTSSSRPRTASSRRSSRTSSSASRRASRSSSAPPRSRSPSSSPGCSTSRASPTTVLNAKHHTREAGDRRPGGSAPRGHRRDEHGRPRRRHPARRQPRAASPTTSVARRGPRPRLRGGPGALRRRCSTKFTAAVRRRGGRGPRRSAGSTCSAASATRAGGSTTSCVAAPGRQGDPGESRFFLSLEDELMRLFATGAMSWVMDRALPDDVPIEARMVTQGDRAGAEHRRGEERRGPQGRPQVRRGDERAAQGDLRAPHAGHRRRGPARAHARAARGDDRAGRRAAPARATSPRSGTSSGSSTELAQYYPTEFTVEDLEQAETSTSSPRASSPRRSSTTSERERRCSAASEMARELERQVMLQIIDQRWRQHLSEMDYLREGIHLRGIAQTDPLVAWQREGFEMFGKLMDADRRRLRALRHPRPGASPSREAPRTTPRRASRPPTTRCAGLADVGRAERRVRGRTAAERPPDAPPAGDRGPAGPERPGGCRPAGAAPASGGARRRPTAAAKVGRNDPCWCGSGKKFKLCHGAS